MTIHEKTKQGCTVETNVLLLQMYKYMYKFFRSEELSLKRGQLEVSAEVLANFHLPHLFGSSVLPSQVMHPRGEECWESCI